MITVRPRSHRRGASGIEHAVCLSAVLLATFGLIQMSLLSVARNSVSYAVQQAARYASMRGAESGEPAGADQIRRYVREHAPALDSSRLIVTAKWTPDNKPGSIVEVEAVYQAPVFLPILGPSVPLRSSAALPITQ